MKDRIIPSLTLTKLHKPRVGRGLVPRPHLLERLNASQGLTLVLAPAGYGKTTLLSTWLDTCQVPHVWLSLDAGDDDLAVFVTYLAEALRSLFPTVADNTLAFVSGVTVPPPEIVARNLLNDLSTFEEDFILVLDDYHLIRQQAIHDLMTELVRHLPHTLRLVIASRHDPLLPLAWLRARGQVVELRAADLRFTLEESARFMREAMALTVDEQLISALATKTEGWPAGLHLAALSMRQRHTRGMLAADAFGDNRYVMDYLVAEVLSQLPISIQEFLIKTSILDQLCSPLCEAVTGMVDRMFNGQYILEWLERADLFLTPADDEQHWYRCHRLFRQLLLHRLQQLHGSAEIAALHLRASAWFAANDYLDEALQHALAAGNMPAAVQLVAQHRHQLMNQGRWQRLERWLHLFPAEVISEQPDLLLIDVWMKFFRQQLGAVPALLDRIEVLFPSLSPQRVEPLQGEVTARRSALYFWNGDVKRSLNAAQQALDKLPADWWYIRGYTRLFVSQGHLMSGDLTQTFAAFHETGEITQNWSYQNLLTGLACFSRWITADLSDMAQAARQALAGSDPLDRTETATWSQYHLGLYHYQRNELAAAEKQLMPLVSQPYLSHANCFFNSAVLLARMRLTQGQLAEAQTIGDTMLSFAFETRSEVLLSNARAFQAELALRQGRLAEAGQWAVQYDTFKPSLAPHAFVPSVVLAMILLAQDTSTSLQQVRRLLTQLDEYFTSIHYTVVRIQVLALQAMLYHAEDNEPQALTTLARSIALAESGGFLRLFVDLGPQLKPLLETLAQRGVSPAYLNEINAVYGDQVVSDSSRSIASAPLEILTNREIDVLLLLNKRFTDKEIAEALSISLETVRTHVRHISDKLGVRGRRAIVQAARDRGWLA